MTELKVGDYYDVTYHNNFIQYGTWKLTGIGSGRLWFEDTVGTGLSIPKDPSELAPASPWSLQIRSREV